MPPAFSPPWSREQSYTDRLDAAVRAGALSRLSFTVLTLIINRMSRSGADRLRANMAYLIKMIDGIAQRDSIAKALVEGEALGLLRKQKCYRWMDHPETRWTWVNHWNLYYFPWLDGDGLLDGEIAEADVTVDVLADDGSVIWKPPGMNSAGDNPVSDAAPDEPAADIVDLDETEWAEIPDEAESYVEIVPDCMKPATTCTPKSIPTPSLLMRRRRLYRLWNKVTKVATKWRGRAAFDTS